MWARILVGVALAGLALVSVLDSRAADARQETFNLEQRVTILDRQVAVRRGELTQLSQMESVIREFNDLVATQGDLTGILDKINAIVPEGVEIASFSATASNVSVSGKADSPEAAIAYVNALRASGLVSKVTYTQTKTGELAFSLAADRIPQPKK